MRPWFNMLLVVMLALQPVVLVTAEAGHVDAESAELAHCPDCEGCCDDEPACDDSCALSLCSAGGTVFISADPRITEMLGEADELEDPLSCLSGGIPPVLLRPPIIV